VEGKEGRTDERGDEAPPVPSVNDAPPGLQLRVEREGVHDVALPEDPGAAGSEHRRPDAQDDVVLSQEEGVNVGRVDIPARDGGENLSLAGCGRRAEDAVRRVHAEVEVEVEVVACLGVKLGMGAGHGALEVGVQPLLL